MHKREVAFTQARAELLQEMLRAGAFDMDAHRRGEFVAQTIALLRDRHGELDEAHIGKLYEVGKTAVYGDATLNVAARRERGSTEPETEQRP